MKRCLFFFILSLLSFLCYSQSDPVIMRINDKEIRRSEFECYYNSHIVSSPDKLFPRDYVDIFVNNKLKIAEAKSLGLDTLSSFRSEIGACQRQLGKEFLASEIYSVNHSGQVYGNKDINGKGDVVHGYHIYKYLPQKSSANEINKAVELLNSIYRKLADNPSLDFIDIVDTYSDDKSPFSLSRFQSAEEFEKIVFSMNTGEISEPFITPQGIHIVKLTGKGIAGNDYIRDNIRLYPGKRNNSSAGNADYPLIEKLKREHSYSPVQPAIDELHITGNTSGVLFTIDGSIYTMDDFVFFSKDNPQSLKKRLNGFIAKSLYDHEHDLLAVKYPEVDVRLEELRDQILLSEITKMEMQDITDEAGLNKYFDTHKKNYYWELPKYKGIVVHCNSKKTSRQLKKQLRKLKPEKWVDFIETNYNKTERSVIVEEGVFAVGQNDFVDKMVFKVGRFTPLQKHPVSMVMGKKVKGPESYEEIYDVVITDYRNYLEAGWINRLHDKSKVEINEEVLKTVNNH